MAAHNDGQTYKVAPRILEPFSMQRKYLPIVLPGYAALAYVSGNGQKRQDSNKTLELTDKIGRYPESEYSKPSADTKDCIAKIKKALEIDERTTTLAIAAGFARRNTQCDRVTDA